VEPVIMVVVGDDGTRKHVFVLTGTDIDGTG
jgi:hypothetical protein